MGTWSTSLYGNDVTDDVRDTYLRHLKFTRSAELAQERTLSEYQEYQGDFEEPLVWYALADTQWKFGILSPEVKAAALAWIEQGGGLDAWPKNSRAAARWQQTLEKLRTKLNSPQPKARSLDDYFPDNNPWKTGDLYAYRFHTRRAKEDGLFGKYICFQKIGEEVCQDDTFMRVQLYDKLFDQLPGVDELDGVRLLPFDMPEGYFLGKWDTAAFPLCLNAVMDVSKKSDLSSRYFTYIGHQESFSHGPLANFYHSSYSWNGMERGFLCEYVTAWRDYQYSVNGTEIIVSKRDCVTAIRDVPDRSREAHKTAIDKKETADREYDAESAFLDALEARGTVSEQELTRLTELSDSPVRARVAALLVLCEGETAKKLLLKLSRDADAAVRLEAYDSLVVFPGGDVEARLWEAVQTEPDELAQSYALLSWAEVYHALDKDSGTVLLKLERQRAQAESGQALLLCFTYALYLLGKADELSCLLRFLTCDDYHVRCMTLSLLEEVLTETNRKQIKDSLTHLLQTETTPAVRTHAENLLKTIG